MIFIKKLIIVPLILFLLCSCSAKKQITPVLSNVSFTADIDLGGQKYVCDATVTEDNLNLTVTSPKDIEGLALSLNKKGLSSDFLGVSYDAGASSLPQEAVPLLIYNVINDAKGKTVDISDKNCSLCGTVDGKSYVFTFSPSGLPLTLKIDELKTTVKFSNVTLK